MVAFKTIIKYYNSLYREKINSVNLVDNKNIFIFFSILKYITLHILKSPFIYSKFKEQFILAKYKFTQFLTMLDSYIKSPSLTSSLGENSTSIQTDNTQKLVSGGGKENKKKNKKENKKEKQVIFINIYRFFNKAVFSVYDYLYNAKTEWNVNWILLGSVTITRADTDLFVLIMLGIAVIWRSSFTFFNISKLLLKIFRLIEILILVPIIKLVGILTSILWYIRNNYYIHNILYSLKRGIKQKIKFRLLDNYSVQFRLNHISFINTLMLSYVKGVKIIILSVYSFGHSWQFLLRIILPLNYIYNYYVPTWFYLVTFMVLITVYMYKHEFNLNALVNASKNVIEDIMEVVAFSLSYTKVGKQLSFSTILLNSIRLFICYPIILCIRVLSLLSIIFLLSSWLPIALLIFFIFVAVYIVKFRYLDSQIYLIGGNKDVLENSLISSKQAFMNIDYWLYEQLLFKQTNTKVWNNIYNKFTISGGIYTDFKGFTGNIKKTILQSNFFNSFRDPSRYIQKPGHSTLKKPDISYAISWLPNSPKRWFFPGVNPDILIDENITDSLNKVKKSPNYYILKQLGLLSLLEESYIESVKNPELMNTIDLGTYNPYFLNMDDRGWYNTNIMKTDIINDRKLVSSNYSRVTLNTSDLTEYTLRKKYTEKDISDIRIRYNTYQNVSLNVKDRLTYLKGLAIPESTPFKKTLYVEGLRKQQGSILIKHKKNRSLKKVLLNFFKEYDMFYRNRRALYDSRHRGRLLYANKVYKKYGVADAEYQLLYPAIKKAIRRRQLRLAWLKKVETNNRFIYMRDSLNLTHEHLTESGVLGSWMWPTWETVDEIDPEPEFYIDLVNINHIIEDEEPIFEEGYIVPLNCHWKSENYHRKAIDRLELLKRRLGGNWQNLDNQIKGMKRFIVKQKLLINKINSLKWKALETNIDISEATTKLNEAKIKSKSILPLDELLNTKNDLKKLQWDRLEIQMDLNNKQDEIYDLNLKLEDCNESYDASIDDLDRLQEKLNTLPAGEILEKARKTVDRYNKIGLPYADNLKLILPYGSAVRIHPSSKHRAPYVLPLFRYPPISTVLAFMNAVEEIGDGVLTEETVNHKMWEQAKDINDYNITHNLSHKNAYAIEEYDRSVPEINNYSYKDVCKIASEGIDTAEARRYVASLLWGPANIRSHRSFNFGLKYHLDESLVSDTFVASTAFKGVFGYIGLDKIHPGFPNILRRRLVVGEDVIESKTQEGFEEHCKRENDIPWVENIPYDINFATDPRVYLGYTNKRKFFRNINTSFTLNDSNYGVYRKVNFFYLRSLMVHDKFKYWLENRVFRYERLSFPRKTQDFRTVDILSIALPKYIEPLIRTRSKDIALFKYLEDCYYKSKPVYARYGSRDSTEIVELVTYLQNSKAMLGTKGRYRDMISLGGEGVRAFNDPSAVNVVNINGDTHNIRRAWAMYEYINLANINNSVSKPIATDLLGFYEFTGLWATNLDSVPEMRYDYKDDHPYLMRPSFYKSIAYNNQIYYQSHNQTIPIIPINVASGATLLGQKTRFSELARSQLLTPSVHKFPLHAIRDISLGDPDRAGALEIESYLPSQNFPVVPSFHNMTEHQEDLLHETINRNIDINDLILKPIHTKIDQDPMNRDFEELVRKSGLLNESDSEDLIQWYNNTNSGYLGETKEETEKKLVDAIADHKNNSNKRYELLSILGRLRLGEEIPTFKIDHYYREGKEHKEYKESKEPLNMEGILTKDEWVRIRKANQSTKYADKLSMYRTELTLGDPNLSQHNLQFPYIPKVYGELTDAQTNWPVFNPSADERAIYFLEALNGNETTNCTTTSNYEFLNDPYFSIVLKEKVRIFDIDHFLNTKNIPRRGMKIVNPDIRGVYPYGASPYSQSTNRTIDNHILTVPRWSAHDFRMDNPELDLFLEFGLHTAHLQGTPFLDIHGFDFNVMVRYKEILDGIFKTTGVSPNVESPALDNPWAFDFTIPNVRTLKHIHEQLADAYIPKHRNFSNVPRDKGWVSYIEALRNTRSGNLYRNMLLNVSRPFDTLLEPRDIFTYYKQDPNILPVSELRKWLKKIYFNFDDLIESFEKDDDAYNEYVNETEAKHTGDTPSDLNMSAYVNTLAGEIDFIECYILKYANRSQVAIVLKELFMLCAERKEFVMNSMKYASDQDKRNIINNFTTSKIDRRVDSEALYKLVTDLQGKILKQASLQEELLELQQDLKSKLSDLTTQESASLKKINNILKEEQILSRKLKNSVGSSVEQESIISDMSEFIANKNKELSPVIEEIDKVKIKLNRVTGILERLQKIIERSVKRVEISKNLLIAAKYGPISKTIDAEEYVHDFAESHFHGPMIDAIMMDIQVFRAEKAERLHNRREWVNWFWYRWKNRRYMNLNSDIHDDLEWFWHNSSRGIAKYNKINSALHNATGYKVKKRYRRRTKKWYTRLQKNAMFLDKPRYINNLTRTSYNIDKEMLHKGEFGRYKRFLKYNRLHKLRYSNKRRKNFRDPEAFVNGKKIRKKYKKLRKDKLYKLKVRKEYLKKVYSKIPKSRRKHVYNNKKFIKSYKMTFKNKGFNGTISKKRLQRLHWYTTTKDLFRKTKTLKYRRNWIKPNLKFYNRRLRKPKLLKKVPKLKTVRGFILGIDKEGVSKYKRNIYKRKLKRNIRLSYRPRTRRRITRSKKILYWHFRDNVGLFGKAKYYPKLGKKNHGFNFNRDFKAQLKYSETIHNKFNELSDAGKKNRLYKKWKQIYMGVKYASKKNSIYYRSKDLNWWEKRIRNVYGIRKWSKFNGFSLLRKKKLLRVLLLARHHKKSKELIKIKNLRRPLLGNSVVSGVFNRKRNMVRDGYITLNNRTRKHLKVGYKKLTNNTYSLDLTSAYTPKFFFRSNRWLLKRHGEDPFSKRTVQMSNGIPALLQQGESSRKTTGDNDNTGASSRVINGVKHYKYWALPRLYHRYNNRRKWSVLKRVALDRQLVFANQEQTGFFYKRPAWRNFMLQEKGRYQGLLKYQEKVLREYEFMSLTYGPISSKDTELVKNKLKTSYYLISTNFWYRRSKLAFRRMKLEGLKFAYCTYGPDSSVFKVYLANYRSVDLPPLETSYLSFYKKNWQKNIKRTKHKCWTKKWSLARQMKKIPFYPASKILGWFFKDQSKPIESFKHPVTDIDSKKISINNHNKFLSRKKILKRIDDFEVFGSTKYLKLSIKEESILIESIRKEKDSQKIWRDKPLSVRESLFKNFLKSEDAGIRWYNMTQLRIVSEDILSKDIKDMLSTSYSKRLSGKPANPAIPIAAVDFEINRRNTVREKKIAKLKYYLSKAIGSESDYLSGNTNIDINSLKYLQRGRDMDHYNIFMRSAQKAYNTQKARYFQDFSWGSRYKKRWPKGLKRKNFHSFTWKHFKPKPEGIVGGKKKIKLSKMFKPSNKKFFPRNMYIWLETRQGRRWSKKFYKKVNFMKRKKKYEYDIKNNSILTKESQSLKAFRHYSDLDLKNWRENISYYNKDGGFFGNSYQRDSKEWFILYHYYTKSIEDHNLYSKCWDPKIITAPAHTMDRKEIARRWNLYVKNRAVTKHMYKYDIEAWKYWDIHMKKEKLAWDKYLSELEGTRNKEVNLTDKLIKPLILTREQKYQIYYELTGIWPWEDKPASWLKIIWWNIKIAFVSYIRSGIIFKAFNYIYNKIKK